MSPRMDREVSVHVDEFGTIPESADIRSPQTKRPMIVPDLVLKEYGEPLFLSAARRTDLGHSGR
jgi:hypothetical protein